ncbi:unnamed protein product, partial [Iphiclides podalirius]
MMITPIGRLNGAGNAHNERARHRAKNKHHGNRQLDKTCTGNRGQRATLAEKEVTTLKEQLATTSPTPLQATVPPKTNGSHIEATRDQATETRIPERLSPDIKRGKETVARH